jgi:hypothetical protein
MTKNVITYYNNNSITTFICKHYEFLLNFYIPLLVEETDFKTLHGLTIIARNVARQVVVYNVHLVV